MSVGLGFDRLGRDGTIREVRQKKGSSFSTTSLLRHFIIFSPVLSPHLIPTVVLETREERQKILEDWNKQHIRRDHPEYDKNMNNVLQYLDFDEEDGKGKNRKI